MRLKFKINRIRTTKWTGLNYVEIPDQLMRVKIDHEQRIVPAFQGFLPGNYREHVHMVKLELG